MAKKVTVINAISDSKHTQPQQRLKVCAYARVSTGSRAQAESYATQVEYYTEKIENNPLWEFAGVYADEGITGTKVKGRDDFKAMVAACEEGDIDLILTKSITRFARNTVECIQTIRKLKAIGVGIYFEKEGINTLTEASELMLTILASVAQGESEDFSGNNRWAIINRFENGTFIVGTPAYGYRKDEDGNLIIEETEAEVVRWIFEAYLNGMGAYVIAKMLNDHKIPTIRGSEKWQDSVVKNILMNPVYEGDALHQRTYTEKQLVYSCHNCNSTICKGQKNTVLSKNGKHNYRKWTFKIVHPYIDDPMDYFEVPVSSSGERRAYPIIKKGIDREHKNKAKETIKMFGLDGEKTLELAKEQLAISQPEELQRIIEEISSHRPD